MKNVINKKLNLEDLQVGGYLDLSGTGITSLPEDLQVGGYLDLSGTAITSLPKGLCVGGSLYLRNTAITSLPEDLQVGGSLYLSGTAITSLPKGLCVGDYLDLRNTAITSYPVVYNCGNENRAIYLDLVDKNLICIGCFKGTKEEAMKVIGAKYSGAGAESYIAKVNECFDMYSVIKQQNKDKQ